VTLTASVIVEAAAELVDLEGIERLTLGRIADRLGVTQPALYRHVDGVDDLLRRLALAARRRLLAALRDAAVGRSGDLAVREVATAWRLFVNGHPGLYAATDRSPLAGDPENESAVADIVDLLTRIIEGYGLAERDARDAAWALRSALHGFSTLEVTSGNPASLELDEAFDRLVSLLTTGFEAWPPLTIAGRRDRRQADGHRPAVGSGRPHGQDPPAR
jgi:AcrR family transcriptional regulator